MSVDPSSPAFVDTNVLVYAATLDDVRCESAQRLVHELMDAQTFRTSTQVLEELFVTVTRKIPETMTHSEALRYLDGISAYPVYAMDYSGIREAAELAAHREVSFWDSLIVVAARRSGAKRLYTEDLRHGETILGVKIINPFRPA